VSRTGNQITLLSWGGATIHYSWDDVTYSTYTDPLTIPEGAQVLYYYAEDAYYTEATKTLFVGSTLYAVNGARAVLASMSGGNVSLYSVTGEQISG